MQPKERREGRAEGIREGVQLCIVHMREVVAGRAVTGFQAALILERAMIGAETPEAIARRKAVDALRATATS